ncbi:PREDICTED: uncharacterized protein LOC105964401 [Erythranthe guttata]|uniref:uncharacterized protein LOC105964401 n=1 Tax=Erythranthe guttata TaxID=4155 RepID=UPI00064E0F57|nr:PREDICTED: uncharacterized protein LOC105964401 [Erythranthe guttata]|eukprot:XP_012844371.1 PREDICTED: uncharacterized protein LOC105964401 [Erythranthe guttata]
MDDVLARLRSRLKLTYEELETTPPLEAWKNMDLNTDLQLIGRILSRKKINRDALEITMPKVWSPVHGTSVEKIGEGRFIFHFKHKLDRAKALEDGPWCFDKNLTMLDKISEDKTPKQISLDWRDFFVHVSGSGLPLLERNRAMATHIGNTLGFLKINECKDGFPVFGDVLRIRVLINVTKPLRRLVKLSNTKGEITEVSLEYERLPNFCYYCGLMVYSFSPEQRDDEPPYGDWLKATSPSQATIQQAN